MNPIQPSRQQRASACLAGFILMGALTGGAANYWIDVNGVTSGNGVADGGSYDWTAANWGDFAGTATPVVWPGGSNQAFMTGAGTSTSYTVRLGSSGSSNVTLQNFAINVNSGLSGASGNGDVVIGNPGDSGLLTLNAANSFGAYNGTLTVNNGINLNGVATNFRGGSVTINGVVSGTGSSNLALAGGAFGLTSGTLTLAGNNSYAGTTTVANNYTLVAQHANALGGTTSGTTVSSGGVVQVAGGVSINAGEAISVAGGGANFFGALQAGSSGGTWAGQVTLGDTSVRLGALAAQTLSITGSIVSGAGTGFNVSGQSGTGVVLLNPTTSNTYTGTTGIIRGILRLGKTDALPTGTTLDVDSVGSVGDAAVFDLASFSQTVAALQDTASDAAGTIRNSVASTTSTLTVNQTANTSFQGLIENGTGTVALTKAGTGSLTLTGANTFTGGTIISGGAIVAANTAALGASGRSVRLNTGSTLDLATDTSANAWALDMGSGNTGTVLVNRATSGAGITHVMGNSTLGNATFNVQAGALVSGGSPTLQMGGINLTAGSSGTLLLNPTTADMVVTGAVNIGGNNFAKTLGLGGTSAGNEVSGVISNNLNTLSVTKSGTGTWTLSGANTYTGVTTISAGILNVATLSNYGVAGALGARTSGQEGSANIGLRFLGGTLQYTGATAQSTDRQIRIGTAGGTIDASGSVPGATVSFTHSGANTDLFDTAGTRTLTLTGTNTGDNTFAIGLANQSSNATSLTKSGSGKWVLSGNNTHTGLTSMSAGTFVITGNNSIGRVDVNGGTFQVTGGTTSLSSYFTVNTSGSSGAFLQSGGTVQLTSGTNGAYVGNTGSPASVFTMSGGTFTVAGSEGFRMRAGGTSTTSISGGALLAATGSSGLYFNKSSGSAIFNLGDGSTFVSGTSGTLTVSKVWRDAGTSNTFNFNGGTLKASAGSASFFADDANITTLVKAAGGIVDNGGFTITIGEQLAEDGGSPGGGMTFKGSGMTTLSGVNSYTGLTTVSGGGVIVQNSSALGTSTGGVTVSAGARLAVQNGVTVAGESVTINGDGGNYFGALQAVGAGTAEWAGNVVIGSDNTRIGTQTDASLTVSGVISGSSSNKLLIRKEWYSVGEVIFTNANIYQGETQLYYGTLHIQNNAALGSTVNGTRVIGNTGFFGTLGLSNNITVTGETLTLEARQGDTTNHPHLANLSGNNTWAGTIQTSTGGVYYNIESQSGTLTLSGPLNNSLTGSRIWTFGGAAEGTVSGVIGGGAQAGAQVTKKGAGTWTFSNANLYTGTTVIDQGTLRLSTNTAAGSGTLRLNGGRLTSDANPRTLANPVLVTLDSALGSATAGFDGPIVLNGNLVLQGADSSRVLTVDSPVTLAGTVSGSSLRGITKTGDSTLTLSGSGNWNGNTSVSAGTFQVTGTSSIPFGGNLNTSGSGVFRMTTTGAVNASSTSIVDSSEIRLEAGTLRTNSITMGGTGTFNWTGGTLQTYSNAVLGSGSDVSQSGGAAVYGGRTLAVTGNLATGAGVNLDLGNLYLSGSVLYNQITITGSLSVGAGTTLSALDSPYLLRPSTGGMSLDWGTLVLVDAAGGITNPSNFAFVAPLSDGRPFSEFTGTWVSAGDPAQLDPDTWYLEYTANQVLFHYKVSAAIPEPASAGLLLFGGLLLRALSRRRRGR